MKTKKLSFQNKDGQNLSGKLELPVDQEAHNFVLFAHCFTCNKNLTAIRNISHSLISEGYAVFRFDFTGLGESEGEFSDTNFSSNVEDLIDAANFLAKEFQAPSILIGHSLGGAAVLHAATKLPSVKAVATIGAPCSPDHVQNHFESNKEEIAAQGEAVVNIGGRSFKIKQQFIQDLEESKINESIENLNKALLVMHSPIDRIVGIDNAKHIYHIAQHPKSFVSLDQADHLLSKKADSLYVGRLIAAWATRYVSIPEEENLVTDQQVVVRTGNESYTTDIKAGKHHLTADEPESVGGNDFGPSPYGLLSSALGACTSMTLQMYAGRKGWDLQEVKVHLSHGKDYLQDNKDFEKPSSKIDIFERKLELIGALDEKQKKRLLEIADRCPVHRTLHSEIAVKTELI